MNTAITTVVPHPGATFPYSELSGRNAVHKAVTFPVPASFVSLLILINFLHSFVFFYFLL